MSDIYKKLLRLAQPLSIHDYFDTQTSVTEDELGHCDFSWLASVTKFTLSNFGLGGVNTLGTNRASSASTGKPPLGPKSIELIFQLNSYPVAGTSHMASLFYLGSSARAVTGGDLHLGVTGPGYTPITGRAASSLFLDTTGSNASVPISLNTPYHVVIRDTGIGANSVEMVVNNLLHSGKCQRVAYNSDVYKIASDQANGSIPSARISLHSVFSRVLSDEEIGKRYSSLLGLYKLAGIALREDQEPVDVVLVRDVLTRDHLSTVVPDVNGAWELRVPPGDYEVTAVGPDGYQPETFSPVASVPV